MLIKRTLVVAVIAAVSVSMTGRIARAEEPAKKTSPWFSGLALAGHGGSAWLETARSDDFTLKLNLGGQVIVDVLRVKDHYVVLDAGYLYLFGSDSTGTEEVSVSTSYHRIDAALGYDFRYKLFVLGARFGGAGMIFKTITELWNTTYEVVGSELVVKDDQIIGFRKDIGINFGLLGRIEIGVDISGLFGGASSAAELRLRAELVRRGEREEIYTGLVLVFRPTSLS